MSISIYNNTAVVWSDGKLPPNTEALLQSDIFKHMLLRFLNHLRQHRSPLLSIFPDQLSEEKQEKHILEAIQLLNRYTKEEVIAKNPDFEELLSDQYTLNQFIEELYNYWRNFERYLICISEKGANYELKPYRTFNDTISLMNDLVRKAYRDICENITGEHPQIYRQVAAGFQVGIIAVKKEWPCPDSCKQLQDVPFIRQVLLNPPLIINPPMNKRTGQFTRTYENPLNNAHFSENEWMCYPAKVGSLLIHIYFHDKFIGLGCALSNLFQLADNKDLKNEPDAIYAFGLPKGTNSISQAVFYDSENMLIAAAPCTDEFGYFGYLKKMTLTLHNIAMMKKGRMPVHGAMVRIELKNGEEANVLISGDTGAGKSETLEAFRMLGKEHIRSMIVIFDDMGSLEIKEGSVLAYGTEIGAFVRLDDLQPGFAFGNMDRSIIMSPQKTNARAVIPVTNITEVLRGHKVDYCLYANNYETVDEEHPYLERFSEIRDAFKVFKEGAVMSKGTTNTTGIVHTYFANIFGPAQYKEIHEEIAKKFFSTMFKNNVFVGQLRTQLGIKGKETDGPEQAAKAIFASMTERTASAPS